MTECVLVALGAPVDGPPCILQRPLAIAGDRQGLPLRVLAPHRLARCMSKCMGLFLRFAVPAPPPRHISDYGLPALIDVDVLHRDLLLSLAAMSIERL